MKPTPVDQLFSYVSDDQSNEYDVTAARNEYDALRFILQEAIEAEEGNYRNFHVPSDPDQPETEPAWMWKARAVLENGIAP